MQQTVGHGETTQPIIEIKGKNMETQTRSSKPLHPLAWITGIALILFSVAGVSALMGWIPNSTGGQDSKALATQPATAQPRAGAAPVQRAAPSQRPAPAQVATSAPVRSSCAECGVIESVQEIDTKGKGSGIGVVGGAVVGGLLGNQVGGGRGQDVMTVVGAVGGAVAGNEVEKRVNSTKSYSITIRFEDGSSRAISSSTAPTWRAGDKVKVVNGSIQSNA